MGKLGKVPNHQITEYTEKAHCDAKQGCNEPRPNKYTLGSGVLGGGRGQVRRALTEGAISPPSPPPNNSQAEHLDSETDRH